MLKLDAKAEAWYQANTPSIHSVAAEAAEAVKQETGVAQFPIMILLAIGSAIIQVIKLYRDCNKEEAEARFLEDAKNPGLIKTVKLMRILRREIGDRRFHIPVVLHLLRVVGSKDKGVVKAMFKEAP